MELYINFTQPIVNVIPTYCVSTNEMNISKLLFRSLYQLEHNIVKRDLVLNDYHNKDYTSWIIRLGAYRWSDDTEGTIEDLVNTWKFVIKNDLLYSTFLLSIQGAVEYQKGESLEITGLKVKDKFTLQIDLTRPLPYFREILTNITLAPVRIKEKEIFTYKIEDFNSNTPLITSKKSKIKEWNKQEIKIEDNEININNYFFNKYTFTFTNNYEEIFKRFQNNTLHIHDGGTQSENSGYLGKYMKYYDFLSSFYLFYNTLHENEFPLFVRQKMNSIVHENMNFINDEDKFQSDKLVPLSLRSWGGINKNEKSHLGVEQKLIFDQTRELVFICNDEAAYISLSKKLIELWEVQLGIKITLKVFPWEAFIEELSRGDFDIARAGWVADYAHPHSFYEVLTSASASNFARWSNKEFDSLFLQSGLEAKISERNKCYEKMDCLIEREAPILPLYEHRLRQLINTNVDCFDVSYTGIINYNTTSLKI